MTDLSHSSTPAGWREWVVLPGAGVPWIKAKLDTGARTSTIHAFDVRVFGDEGAERVHFSLRPWQDSNEDAVRVELPIHDRRSVRSSSGHVQERIVVLMDIVILGRTVRGEVTLSRRDQMGFRMLIGRELLRQGFVVDASRSFLGGKPPKPVRRRNRGK